MLHIRLISVLLKLLENLDKWPRLENMVCGASCSLCPQALAAYKSPCSGLSYVQLQGALHCLQSAPAQSSLLSLKNVWTSECSQVLQSLCACSAADAAAPGVPCCRVLQTKHERAGLCSVWAVRVHLSDEPQDTVWL